MSAWRFVIDVAKCEDCNNCLLACKDEHVGNDWPGVTGPQALHGQPWIDIARRERGQFPLIDVAYRPTPCQHCADAPCVAGSGGAIVARGDGIVLIDPVKAKGRKDLVASCPYGAIGWNAEADAPQKCTFCAHLLDGGWKETRCAQACPTGALRVERVAGAGGAPGDGAGAELARPVTGLTTLHPEHGTRPRAVYLNLQRFDSCFIAGSVAVRKDGVVDCAAGVTVTLRRGGTEIAHAATDVFGDFKFDGLEPGSGPYTLDVAQNGTSRVLSVTPLESVSLGVIEL